MRYTHRFKNSVEKVCPACKLIIYVYKKEVDNSVSGIFYCGRQCQGLSHEEYVKTSREFNCARCLETKERSFFIIRTQPNGKLYVNSYCKTCMTAKRREHYDKNKKHEVDSHNAWRKSNLESSTEDSLLWFFKRRMSSVHHRTRKKGFLESDISPEWLVEKYKEQNGLCFYSGELMEWRNYGLGKGNKNLKTISIDRVDPSKGYTRGNVVLCTYMVNTMKLTDSEAGFISKCRKIVNTYDSRIKSTS